MLTHLVFGRGQRQTNFNIRFMSTSVLQRLFHEPAARSRRVRRAMLFSVRRPVVLTSVVLTKQFYRHRHIRRANFSNVHRRHTRDNLFRRQTRLINRPVDLVVTRTRREDLPRAFTIHNSRVKVVRHNRHKATLRLIAIHVKRRHDRRHLRVSSHSHVL